MALRALCIGINNYPGTGSDLNGCVNDANDWAAELGRRGFEVATLVDGSATGARIRQSVKKLIAAGDPGDTLAVQFSGHGSFVPDADGEEPDGADECLCPTDTWNGYITDDELFRLLAARRDGVHVVMIADSCHSGTISKFAPISGGGGLKPCATEGGKPCATEGGPGEADAEVGAVTKVRFLPPASFLDAAALRAFGARRGLWRASPAGSHVALTLSGCQDAEYSYDGYFRGRPNGVFTHVALETLAALPPNATYTEWFAAIRRRLPSSQYPQTPSLSGPSRMKALPVLGAIRS
jgi:hypothetical protein